MIVECVGIPGSGKTTLVNELCSKQGMHTVPTSVGRAYAFRYIAAHPFFFIRWTLALCLETRSSGTWKLLRFKMAVFLNTAARIQYARSLDRSELVIIDEGMLQRILTLFEKERSTDFFASWIRHMPLPDFIVVLPDSYERRKIGTMRKKMGETYTGRWLEVVEHNSQSLGAALSDASLRRITQERGQSITDLALRLKRSAERPILVVINRLAIGGAERVVLDDIHEFMRRGERTVLLTLGGEKEASLMPQCELPVEDRICIPFSSLLDVRAWVACIRIIKQLHPRAIVSHLWFSNVVARIGGFLAGVRRVITFEHNVYDEVKSKKQFVLDRILQVMSTCIVAVSVAVKNSLTQQGIRPDKIRVVPNGVQLNKFLTHDRREEVRKILGIEAKFVFISVGRLVRQKGHDVLLKALASVDAHLLLVGDGEERTALSKQAQILRITNRVHMLGIRNDIPDLLAAADCFVFPSRWEGMSIVLLEALASRLPIIATRFKGVEEVLDGENAMLVSIDDPVALAESMCSMQSDNILRERLANRAQESSHRFSAAAHAERVLEFCSTN